MRIGIITYWTSQDNYGQLLQCFALQKFLRDRGHDAFLIRYIPAKKSAGVSRFSPSHIFKYIRYRLQQRRNGLSEHCQRNFAGFREHIHWSEREYNGFDSLAGEDWSDTDAFICGSDQIWSEKPDEQLNAYFLKFAPFQKIRIAYAPSFGAPELSVVYQNKLSNLLSGFTALSAREKSGVDIIKAAGYNAEMVADPTLLLSRDTYVREFSLSSDNIRHAFCYFINWDTDCNENEIIEFCRGQGLKPTLFATKGYDSSLPLNEIQSPESWLLSIMSAEMSLVNSFHGLVFSLIFHVPFAVYPLKGRHAAMNARISSLLGLVGLENRIVGPDNSLELVFSRTIDWESVDDRLSALRDKSESFLHKSLKCPDNSTKEKKHNICFMTGGAVHHEYGGLDRVTEFLADKFIADGHSVCYVSLRQREHYDGARQYFLPDSANACSEENGKYMTDFIKKHDIDIVINQEANVNNRIPFERPSGLKVISVLHFNPNYIDDRHFLKKFAKSATPLRQLSQVLFSIDPINKMCLNYLRQKLGRNYMQNLQWSDRFVLLSPRFMPVMQSLVKDGTDIAKTESIYNPLPLSAFAGRQVAKEKIILFVGRLDNNFKRIDELIDDVAFVLANNPEWRFVLCGDGPDREMLENYATKRSDRIEFIGYDDPWSWYDRASVIVLRSSKSEGWGMVLTEAMSRGVVPVVAGSYESLPDIISTETDGIITQDSSEGFRKGLNDAIMSDAGLRKMSSRARESAHRFDIDRIATQWYKLFDL